MTSPSPGRSALTAPIANTISGSPEFTGPVVMAGAVHGDITFPVPTPVVNTPRQLPRSSRLVDRAAERAELDRLLERAGDVPVLVAISGLGGVGKSTLGNAWLRGLRERFPDGQLYGDLRAHAPQGLARADEIAGGWLHGLGVTVVPGTAEERLALLRSLTADRRLVVLLDNAATAAQVRPLLPAGRSVTVVTSRHQLPELSLDDAHMLPLGPLETGPALELLTSALPEQRADREPDQLRELVTLCGGLPLAVRISAALLAARPHTPVTRWVRALASGPLTVLKMEGVSVTQSLDLAYNNLPSPAARNLYGLLALHPGTSVTRGAAAALLSPGTDHARADTAMGELIGHHLVTEIAEGRFTFHDLVREHATTRSALLSEADKAGAVRRLCDYYLSATSQAGHLLEPYRDNLERAYTTQAPREEFSGLDAALTWLEAEQPNLSAVIAMAADQCPESAWQIVDALWPYWLRRRYPQECRDAHQHGLRAAHACGNATGIGRMLTSGALIERRYDPTLSLELLDQAETHFIQQNEPRRAARVPHYRGLTLLALDRPEAATAEFRRAITACEAVDDQRTPALARHNLAGIAYGEGQYETATTYAGRARHALTEIGDTLNASLADALWGRAELALGQTDMAARHLSAAARGLRAVSAHRHLATVLVELGELHENHRRDPGAARDYYREAHALHTSTHNTTAATELERRMAAVSPDTCTARASLD
ncbi:NB-ARC domain-containing protein [Streptomyces scopuliridis]|uniref:NB-ARC domain-containing protein n=1 Tax=Streptomyces scopuliridis TaxID=452529 RepID=A0ACD4ZXD3_9ACTN|nr:NB-ARC domain-containing protein [Streptomyces scopuliridis]WSC01702.1 NB-ARC domain-containing protein [Streptomyces scopuliridis]WSC04759.1 NB-ARC domain-containing protein [Streptomyces scopuliridis]